jgi:AraC-like DNA-binding protein
MSAHRYVSGRRLERAKALLLRGDRSSVDIALALSFSSQANFTERSPKRRVSLVSFDSGWGAIARYAILR